MPRYSGDVTLPDGRKFFVVATFTQREMDYHSGTGGSDLIDAEIYDMDGEEIPVEVQNEEIDWPNRYDSKAKDYLWSACVDLVCQQPPDDDDYDPGY